MAECLSAGPLEVLFGRRDAEEVRPVSRVIDVVRDAMRMEILGFDLDLFHRDARPLGLDLFVKLLKVHAQSPFDVEGLFGFLGPALCILFPIASLGYRSHDNLLFINLTSELMIV